ncbi:MAG: arylsulfatase A, partial [Gammaproteobacteria bacterium]
NVKPGTLSSGISMNIDILPTISALIHHRSEVSRPLDGRDIWSLLQGSNTSPHETLYLFNNEDISALRTQDWKYITRAYYKTNYIAFDRIKEKMGFDYVLFDMRSDMPERYSQAENRPEIVKQMITMLEQGREIFEPLRSGPVPKVFP